MAMSTMWIRNNMIFSSNQSDRQLTEAELKVKRSLQKLSIPDWYLNKRSNPPKILSNIVPVEFRQSSWKKLGSRDSTINSTSTNLSDSFSWTEGCKNIEPPNKPEMNTPPRQQKSPEAKHRKSPTSKSPTARKEQQSFGTTIPEVRLLSNSKTFPKMSPSRKLENINIVLHPGPPINISSHLEKAKGTEKPRFRGSASKKQPTDVASKNSNNDCSFRNSDSTKRDETSRKSPTNESKNSPRSSKIADEDLITPKPRACFRTRATSTPRFTPANLFSSTIIEESPREKKSPSRSILEKSSIFESNSSPSKAKKRLENARRPKKLSESLLQKTSMFEDLSRTGLSSDLEMSRFGGSHPIFEKNVSSIGSIRSENNGPALLTTRSSMVRELVKKLETARTPEKTPVPTWKGRRSLPEKMPDRFKTPVPALRRTSLGGRTANSDLESPFSKFLVSKRKSVDLEKVVKNKLAEEHPRDKSDVRRIIEILMEKLSKPSAPLHCEDAERNHNFVRKVVNALEKGDPSILEEMTMGERSREDSGSCSESVSLKDTDSSSDYDLRSSSFRSDKTFNHEFRTSRKFSEAEEIPLEEESVYWIPVTRCKLPRTSSLLSLTSRLSSNGYSPCISPIKSDSESGSLPWCSTFKRANALSRKLFKIDETVVIDSGYSDRSDQSPVRCSTADSTWSECTQIDSSTEIESIRSKKSFRRRSILDNTYRVRC
ncbi:uncharacterized protein LOC122401558 [Colletes gigas]|uniref:uncharacterized protein LOC122401558 n=1 Tax=Colletes gigas TaxID=935657 RepID=UPI001C9AFCBC|nr:uncharacterized protein LOC122401558 [Colletes gigas]